MTRFILLNPDDTHQDGDEIYMPIQDEWLPVAEIHIGDEVGESYPCRRESNPTNL